MAAYAPKAMELAPRDITSRSIQTEINEGRGIGGKGYVYLDLRHLGAEKIKDRLPGIRDLAIHFEGVDPVEEPVPIVPSQHYSMGGIDTDMDGQTDLPGFYAAGECACVSVHGANRLGGNSLLETVVFGRRAGAAACAVHPDPPTARTPLPAAERAVAGDGSPRGRTGRPGTRWRGSLRHPGRDDHHHEGPLRRVPRGRHHAVPASTECWASRSRVGKVGLRHTGTVLNLDLIRTVELEGMVDVALAIAAGALARTESRAPTPAPTTPSATTPIGCATRWPRTIRRDRGWGPHR